MTDKIRVSEMFLSLQGEGLYTGKNTAWIRLFNCNLSCSGFFQEDPTNPETYVLPYKDFDVSKIQMVEELPVFETGCDSSYSWAKKYKHLIPLYSESEIVDKLELLISGKFYENSSNVIKNTHLCFTGGEPLLKPNQKAVISILSELEKRNNLPKHITFETNTTVHLLPEFIEMLKYYQKHHGVEFLASCSPKLFNVSGELNKRAWNHDVGLEYYINFDKLSYKFVVNDRDETWDELDDYLNKLLHSTDNVYIMPVGATLEQQSTETVINIAKKALDKGFNISGRLHCYMFGNGIGT